MNADKKELIKGLKTKLDEIEEVLLYHNIIMDKILNYKLIGIGEFSHGIMESWIFRFNLLKYAIKNTNKKY